MSHHVRPPRPFTPAPKRPSTTAPAGSQLARQHGSARVVSERERPLARSRRCPRLPSSSTSTMHGAWRLLSARTQLVCPKGQHRAINRITQAVTSPVPAVATALPSCPRHLRYYAGPAKLESRHVPMLPTESQKTRPTIPTHCRTATPPI